MKNVRPLVFAGVCLALCLLLPFLTGQIPSIGSSLLPMHLPVLLCGFVCGPFYGLIVGFISPLLRFVLFGMPPLMPTGLAMAFELAAYGLFAGLLIKAFPRKNIHLYSSLLSAMLLGRIVWGIAAYIINHAIGNSFTWQLFFAGAFVNAVPGIIFQLLVIPPLLYALQKARVVEFD